MSRSMWRSGRYLLAGCSCVLALGLACGENPELLIDDEPFQGAAGPGEPCDTSGDCQESLVCGLEGLCEGVCGDVTGSKTCGREACLADGHCSKGLGKTCTNDEACNEGLVCSVVGRCSVPCEPGKAGQCKGDQECRDTGTCPTDQDRMIGGIGGASNGGGDGEGGASSCIDVKVDFTPQIPTVLLLIDRSGSMKAENFGKAVKDAVDAGTYTLGDCPSNNDWRWNVVRDVLMNPSKGIVKPLEDRVRFGLSLYSSENGQIKPPEDDDDPVEIDPTKMCPVLIDVPISLGNHQAMLDQFKCSDIKDDTPTGESLVAAAATLAKFDEPGPKIIVLATDGEPDTCECPDWGGHVPEKCKASGLPAQIKQGVVDAAEKIHADGVTVHVINVSTPGEVSLQEHLEAVATAGGGQVYPGFSPGALSTAFEEIINGSRPCKIDLDGEIADGKEGTGKVLLDGEPLELDGADGWQVNSPSQIELLGKACEAIKSGEHDLDIQFPCESFRPPVR
jgi:hypothetical protein